MVSGLIETLPQGNARPDDWMDAARQVVRASLVGRQLHHDLEEVIPLRHRGLVLTGLEHLEARAGAYGSGDEAGTRKQLETMLRAIDAIQASDAGAWRSHRSGEEDPLLRIPSRKAFDDDIANAFKEASQTKPLSLLFVDIDNFKYINDSKGHQTGDRVLQGVASRLAEVAARRGKPYRYGGEELTLLMPNTTHEEALSAGISWRNQFIGDLWGVSIGLLIARIQFVASRNAVAEPIERESLTAVTRSLLAFEWVRTKTRAN
jgi:GGDEF domain-containing protein